MDKNLSDGLPLPHRYGAIATIIIGISMAVLDGAIANVALPTIASDLHASPASSIWIVNAYQIAIVVSLLSFSFWAICSAIAGCISVARFSRLPPCSAPFQIHCIP